MLGIPPVEEDDAAAGLAETPECGAPETRPGEVARLGSEEAATGGTAAQPADVWHVMAAQLELLQRSVAQLTVALAEVGARTHVTGGGTRDRRDLADVALPAVTPAPTTFALAAPEQGAAIFSVTPELGADVSGGRAAAACRGRWSSTFGHGGCGRIDAGDRLYRESDSGAEGVRSTTGWPRQTRQWWALAHRVVAAAAGSSAVLGRMQGAEERQWLRDLVIRFANLFSQELLPLMLPLADPPGEVLVEAQSPSGPPLVTGMDATGSGGPPLEAPVAPPPQESPTAPCPGHVPSGPPPSWADAERGDGPASGTLSRGRRIH
ncbi:unnamed protein product [Lampetra fluviatilis]